MVLRTIEMREIGFPVPKGSRKELLEELRRKYGAELEISEEGNMIWVRGDLHNRYKRRRILFLLSGGKLGQDRPGPR